MTVQHGAAIFGTIKTDKDINSLSLVTTLIEAALRGHIVSALQDAKQIFFYHDELNCSTSANCCEMKECLSCRT